MTAEELGVFGRTLAVGRLVVVRRNDVVTLWPGMVALFEGRYTPEDFRAGIKSRRGPVHTAAVQFAESILRAAQERFGDSAQIGEAHPGNRVYRWKFENGTVSVVGTIIPGNISIE